MDNEIDRGGDLLPDRLGRQVHPGHQHHGLDTRERIARAVCMQGGQRSVMSGVHRLQHVERLSGTALSDDDPVGPHPQGIHGEITDRDLSPPARVWRPRLQAAHMLLQETQLRGIFDRHDPLGDWDECGTGVEERRLARSRASRNHDVGASRHARLQQAQTCEVDRAQPDQVVGAERLAREFADRQEGAVDGDRGNNGVDAGAVQQACVQ